MNLGFSTRWPKHMGGKVTDFVPKVWKGLMENHLGTVEQLNSFYFLDSGKKNRAFSSSYCMPLLKPKLHTIRADQKNRWKVGDKIHFTVFRRSPNQFQFAPILNVKSVQRFDLIHRSARSILMIDGEYYCDSDDKNKMLQFVQNDGFDSITQFFQWFNGDFTGKIIHWTNLKY